MAAAVLLPLARMDRSVAVVRSEGERTVVALRGEWDHATWAVLAGVLSRVIALGAGDVVIDLAEAELIDTANVRAFVDTQRLLDSRGRRLSFPSPSSRAVRVLDLSGLTDQATSNWPAKKSRTRSRHRRRPQFDTTDK